MLKTVIQKYLLKKECKITVSKLFVTGWSDKLASIKCEKKKGWI